MRADRPRPPEIPSVIRGTIAQQQVRSGVSLRIAKDEQIIDVAELDYTGNQEKVISLNPTADGLEFTEVEDPIAPGTNAQYWRGDKTWQDFNEAAQDGVGAALTDTATIDFTYNDAAGTITADVKDNSVTFAKMQDISTNTVVGRSTAGSGDPEELATTGSGSVVRATSPTISAPTLSGTTNVSGGQLQFPAAQSASANANTLDDYEEGTFTPNLLFGGAQVSMTFSTRNGRYTKIGRLVYIVIGIVLTAKGSSTGAATISGLPFTSQGVPRAVGSVMLGAAVATIGTPLIFVGASATTADLREFTGSTYANLTDVDFNNNSEIYATFCYEAS